MNKLLNWTLGGFFRTIGRILAFVLLGSLVGFLVYKNDIKITDLLGIGRVYAATTYSWTTKQSRLYLDDHGTETTTSWETIPHTFSPSLPVSQMQYRLQYSGGLKSGNSYKFKVSFLPNPDALNKNAGIWFSDGTTTLTEVNCSGWARESNNYYANICAISPDSDISSSGYLYVRIVFDSSYVNTIRSYVGDFEETKGTGAIIQDSAIDIMNNQNENTQAIIDANMSCTNIDKNNVEQNGYLWTDGSISATNSTTYGITSYIKVDEKTKITILDSNTSDGIATCFYNTNKTLISCINTRTYTTNSQITIPSNTNYIRFTINRNANKPTFKICKNGNQAVTDAITDDSSPDISELADIAGYLPPGPVDSILTLPLTLLNTVNNALGSTCSPIVIPLPFVNSNLTIPCINSLYEQINGLSVALTTIGGILSGIIMYHYLIYLYTWVDDITSLSHTKPRLFGANSDADNWARAD